MSAVKTFTRIVHVKDYMEDAIYIGRSVPQLNIPGSVFANPYRVGTATSQGDVLMRYLHTIAENPLLMHQLPDLRGKTIACWCRHDGEVRTDYNRCHCDVLE